MQNRVDPWGKIIDTAARGAWMGNRGRIHNEDQRIVRPFTLRAWLICQLEFRGRRRQIMAPDRYTELFFLDEATAFAAGHRPCFECRREHFNRFKACWLRANPQHGFTASASIAEIDGVLHAERRRADGSKNTYTAAAGALAEGSFIERDGEPWLLWQGHWHRWTPFGYNATQILLPADTVTVLTPRSVVNTFRAGYTPQAGVQESGVPF